MLSGRTKLAFRPTLGWRERWAALRVLHRTQLVHGPETERFEAEFAQHLNCKYSVAVSSATAGLYLLAMCGRRWLVPAMTHVATAHALETNGVEPLFVDGAVWDERLLDKHPDRALQIMHGPTKAQPAVVHSFYPTKAMTSIEGGMVSTDDEALAAEVRGRRSFSYSRSSEQPMVYDFHQLGLNFRMNEVAAAVGRVQLRRLPEFQRRRRTNIAAFTAAFGDCGAVGDGYCINVHTVNRNKVLSRLRQSGVGASIHYPVAIPISAYYRQKYGHEPARYPESVKIMARAISLPCGPHLRPADMRRMATLVRKAMEP